MSFPFGGEDITRAVELINLPDPVEGTPEYADAQARDASTRSVTAMPWLPQLPENWAVELHDRIEEAERRYAAPNLQSDEYVAGTATKPDDIAIVQGANQPGYLFSAEHATTPASRKDGSEPYPDPGTGGLAAVLAEDYGSALILTGRQTSNFPTNPDHPMRPLLRQMVVESDGYVSVHGKNAGMFVHASDRAEIHACLGLGAEPSEPMREFARKLIIAARDNWGLYLVISNDQPAYIQYPGSTALKRRVDDTPKRSQMAAKGINMATNEALRALSQAGKKVPALQMEITNLLRLTPIDINRKDRVSRIIGVALGYKLVETAVNLTAEQPLEALS